MQSNWQSIESTIRPTGFVTTEDVDCMDRLRVCLDMVIIMSVSTHACMYVRMCVLCTCDCMYDYYMYVYVYLAASVYILVGFKVGPHNHQCSTTFKQPANAAAPPHAPQKMMMLQAPKMASGLNCLIMLCDPLCEESPRSKMITCQPKWLGALVPCQNRCQAMSFRYCTHRHTAA